MRRPTKDTTVFMWVGLPGSQAAVNPRACTGGWPVPLKPALHRKGCPGCWAAPRALNWGHLCGLTKEQPLNDCSVTRVQFVSHLGCHCSTESLLAASPPGAMPGWSCLSFYLFPWVGWSSSCFDLSH